MIADVAIAFLQHRLIQRFLAFEIIIDHALGDGHFLGHALHPRATEAILRKFPGGNIQDFPAGSGRGGPQHRASSGLLFLFSFQGYATAPLSPTHDKNVTAPPGTVKRASKRALGLHESLLEW